MKMTFPQPSSRVATDRASGAPSFGADSSTWCPLIVMLPPVRASRRYRAWPRSRISTYANGCHTATARGSDYENEFNRNLFLWFAASPASVSRSIRHSHRLEASPHRFTQQSLRQPVPFEGSDGHQTMAAPMPGRGSIIHGRVRLRMAYFRKASLWQGRRFPPSQQLSSIHPALWPRRQAHPSTS